MPDAHRFRLKLFLVVGIFSCFAILALSPKSYSQSAVKLKADEELVAKKMIEISRDLNVTCTECHKVENFKEASKVNFKIAKDHMNLVEVLKSNGLDGKKGPIATCYMCHRGELKPAFREGLKVVAIKKETPKENPAEKGK